MGEISFGEDLGAKFVLPLLLSPFIAFFISAFISIISSKTRFLYKADDDSCLCIGEEPKPVLAPALLNTDLISANATIGLAPSAMIGSQAVCADRYGGRAVRINTRSVIDRLHYLSAGAVGFARGINDTPKVVALMAMASILEIPWALSIVGVAMAIGGLISARRVAAAMSHGITKMDNQHGFIANLVTSFLVIFASSWGIPVSTTHVSCDSLFGIGAVNGGAKWKTIGSIFLAWVTTLPLAAAIA